MNPETPETQQTEEPLVTAEAFEEASVHASVNPSRRARKQDRKQARKLARQQQRAQARRARAAEAARPRAPRAPRPTQAPTPAQQQAAALERSAARRARFKQAASRLPRYDVRMAWYKSRWPFIIFLLQFALVAIAVADSLPVVDLFNTAISTTIQGIRGNLDPLVIALTTLGDVPYMAAICLVICLILLIFRRWSSLWFFIVNVLLAVAFVHVLKLVFAIPRPGADTLVALPSSYSFPSAHSFTSLIVLGLIGLFIFRALQRKGTPKGPALIPAILLCLVALLIGLSRIYVGVHWPSDVLAGWLLAATWLSFASALYLYEPTNS